MVNMGIRSIGKECLSLSLSNILVMLLNTLGFEIVLEFEAVHSRDLRKAAKRVVYQFQLRIGGEYKGRQEIDCVRGFATRVTRRWARDVVIRRDSAARVYPREQRWRM